MITPDQIKAELKKILQFSDKIIAAWEGGSAATGYLDKYSDLDLSVVCEEDNIEDVFEIVEKFIKNKLGMIKSFRVPEPAWHGFSQCFYEVKNVPELFYIDLAVIKKSVPDKFTSSGRHGNAVVWFEKEKIIDSSQETDEEINKRGKRIYRMMTSYDFISIIELQKSLKRKKFTEAFHSYYQLLSRNFALMLNLKYRPSKSDFGQRYFYRDLPAEVFNDYSERIKISTMDELILKSFRLIDDYNSIKKELSGKWS